MAAEWASDVEGSGGIWVAGRDGAGIKSLRDGGLERKSGLGQHQFALSHTVYTAPRPRLGDGRSNAITDATVHR